MASARQAGLPCAFSEISIKVPEDTFWQQHCRSKIMQCDALVALLSDHTVHARGVLWEIACARKAGLPIYAIQVGGGKRAQETVAELRDVPVFSWSSTTLDEILGSF
ncbi:TIR domain-containing protein [Congregicoccus parvus]|uniref:TIR domain-containing protein n=1 Tax=Congregicoccus parvus TaxID=3081749 RepID=UPI003FA6053B